MFNVVEFTDTLEVAVIPDIWMIGLEKAVWPPYKSTYRVNRAVKSQEVPQNQWEKYNIRKLYGPETYIKARQKLPHAEMESDLQTVDEDSDEVTGRHSKRAKRSPIKYTDDEYPSNFQRMTTTPKKVLKPVEPDTDSDSDSDKFDSRVAIKPVPPKPSKALVQLKATSSKNTCSEKDNARDMRILTVMEELRSSVDFLHNKMNTIMRNMAYQEDDKEPLDVSFPLKEVANITDLEVKLLDTEQERKIILHLCLIGGSSLQDTVRRILRAVLTNSLALQYNWSGKGMKEGFKNLRLKHTIIKSVRKQREYKDATSASIEKVIREWLRTARDRDGGRRRRDVSDPLLSSERGRNNEREENDCP